MPLFFIIFFSLYAAINYYVFLRGWQALEGYPHARIIYSAAFLLIFTSYILAKILLKSLPRYLYDIMLWTGSFWFALMIYFFLAIIFIDLARFLFFRFNLIPELVRQNYLASKHVLGIIVFLIVSLSVFFGYLNTTRLKVKELNLILHKGKSKLSSLNAVMVSDIHLSPMDNERFLSGIVDRINALNPDIVFIPGDLFDDEAKILTERNIGHSLLSIKSKYGVYASTGNHEYINGIDAAVAFMQSHGLKVIRDSSVMIDGSFYILGREDRSKKQFTGVARKDLEDIIKHVDREYPLILLDHTPFGLQEAADANIDLQLSGHTHHGQIFPGNLITKMIYEVSWGYLKKKDTQYYVSCGAGTWGPRVRIGSNSEIVNLKIRFEE